MYSIYKYKHKEDAEIQKQLEEQRNQQLELQDMKQHRINRQIHANESLQRIQNFSQHVYDNKDIQKSRFPKLYAIQFMIQGTIPLKHPDLYQFRKTNKKKWLGPSFFNRKLLPSRVRVQQNQQEFKKAHLHHEAYEDKQPYKSFDWYRNIDPGKEIGGSYRWKDRTENERIIKNVKRNASMIDHTSRNNKMLINPKWRTSRKLWKKKGKGDFKRYSRQFGSGELTKSAWRKAKFFRSNDPYKKGLEEIGKYNQVRHRVKEKESGDLIFQGVLPKNIWNSRINVSQSIRTEKYDNVFKLRPNYNYYRQQPKMISYKNKTFGCNVPSEINKYNNIIPFVHSQKLASYTVSCQFIISLHRRNLQDIRPINPKIYPNSIKNLLIELMYKSYHTKDGSYTMMRDTLLGGSFRSSSKNKKFLMTKEKIIVQPKQKSKEEEKVQPKPQSTKVIKSEQLQKQLTVLQERSMTMERDSSNKEIVHQPIYGQKYEFNEKLKQQQNEKNLRKKQVALELSFITTLDVDRKQSKIKAIEKCVEIYFKEDNEGENK